MAVVDVDGVAAGRLYARGGRIDVAAEVLYVVAAVKVVRPERTVDQLDVLHVHVAAVRQVHQARAQGLEVGAVFVEAAPYPELLPEAQAVAVDGARAGDGEAVKAVGVYQRGKVVERLPLHAGLHYRIVLYGVDALQHGALLKQQVGALAEEERSAQERAPRHRHHAAAPLCGKVYHALYGLGLQQRGVGLDAVVGKHVLGAEPVDAYARRVVKPLWDGLSVREGVGLSHGRHARQQGQGKNNK